MSKPAVTYSPFANDNVRGFVPLRFELEEVAAQGRRRLKINASLVSIEQELPLGNRKWVAPLASYRGVVLSSRETFDQEKTFTVRLDHCDSELCASLFEAADNAEVVAEWTAWAKALCLPRYLEGEAGDLIRIDATLGKVALGDRRCNRRLTKAVRSRRPRFLAKRKTGTEGFRRAKA